MSMAEVEKVHYTLLSQDWKKSFARAADTSHVMWPGNGQRTRCALLALRDLESPCGTSCHTTRRRTTTMQFVA